MIQTGVLNGRAGPATVNYPPPEGKQPDATHVLQTTAESAHLYRFVDTVSRLEIPSLNRTD